jgi:transposase
MIRCKRCCGEKFIKSGLNKGSQRYQCKDCHYNFIEGDRRLNKDAEMKSLAALLYSQGKGSYGFISKLLKKSRSTIYRWVKQMAESLPDPVIDDNLKEIEIDEIWHFLERKKTRYGSSKL